MKGLPRLLVCTGILFAFAAGTAFASPTLREGAHGHDVLILQQALQKAGYKIKNADGVFGKDTECTVHTPLGGGHRTADKEESPACPQREAHSPRKQGI